MSGLENNLFQLKFTAKQLNKQSKKCQKEEAGELLKLKKAMQAGNTQGARIYADNAIRKKNEGLHLLRLSSRIDATASRVQTAITMRMVSASMANVVRGMDRAMESMNMEKISMVMDKFESQFEDLDVQTQYIEGAMGGTTSIMTPQAQVESLMQQVAEEHGLEIQQQLTQLEPSKGIQRQEVEEVEEEEKHQDELLGQRLRALRQ
ncbi:hypothetical protein BDF14DRAFT_904571 [Spinellus fusiger]|nr:hypothetical protein BDF14DRAFT_904571 [Spinellus fusiger]